MRSRGFTLAFILGAVAVIAAGCGGGGSTAASNSSNSTGTNSVASSSSSSASSSSGSTSGGGTFRSGKATIVTPSETIEVPLSSGSFIKSLGSHGSVSVNWADQENNDVVMIGDGNGGYKLSVIGRAAPNGITQNDCTASVTKDQASGVEGTYTCGGGITGTFEAH